MAFATRSSASIYAAVRLFTWRALERGVFLNVSVNDPQRLLQQTLDGPLTPRKVIVVAQYANGAYQGALNTAIDSAGRHFQPAIPAAQHK